MEKLICAQCGKEDFKECVVEDGKTFCCAVCSTAYKKQKDAKGGNDEEQNVCKFC